MPQLAEDDRLLIMSGDSMEMSPLFVAMLFIMVSFAYNVSWTAIGTLIQYYSEQYGPSFFVLLNVGFYAMGYGFKFHTGLYLFV